MQLFRNQQDAEAHKQKELSTLREEIAAIVEQMNITDTMANATPKPAAPRFKIRNANLTCAALPL
jgi:hypothetical protein